MNGWHQILHGEHFPSPLLFLIDIACTKDSVYFPDFINGPHAFLLYIFSSI